MTLILNIYSKDIIKLLLMDLEKIIKKMTLNVVNMYKNKCQIKNCDRCVSEKNKKSNRAKAELLDCDYNFL